MDSITLIGLSIVLLYSLTQILNFYGIDQSAYGAYMLFYIFIVISILVLPNTEPKT
jgi:branched-subunit amino acid ABC-type transport system permease component